MTEQRKVVPVDAVGVHPQYGVHGFLWLLVAGLLVFGPILGAWRTHADLFHLENQVSGLNSLPQWAAYKAATWCSFLAFAVVSVYGGWGLARGSDWSVVRRATIILWLVGPVSTVVRGVVVPLVTLGDSNAEHPELFRAMLFSMIHACIWTAYLQNSERVRVTYPRLQGLTHVADETAGTRHPENTLASDFHEQLWAQALAEYESSARRPGLWAHSFSQAQGDEALAKVNYLKSRVDELLLAHQRDLLDHEQATRDAAERARLEVAAEEQRVYDAAPKGHCPNCKALILVSASACPKCTAMFGAGSAWQVRPLKGS